MNGPVMNICIVHIQINGVNLVGVAHQTGVQTMRGVQDEGVITIQRRVYQLEKREIADVSRHNAHKNEPLKTIICFAILKQHSCRLLRKYY